MRISYELGEFSDEDCEDIVKRLLIDQIPHIFENKCLLVDETDEDLVDLLLSQIGNSDPTQDLELSSTSNYWSESPTTQEIIDRFIEQSASQVDISQSLNGYTDDEPGAIAMAGLIIGGGFGVFIVIAAFLDPTFEGRVYIFLPAIILGLLGFALGTGLEKLIKQFRKKS